MHLFRHCVQEKITLTRSRSEHSNDGARMQQKNWAVVRTVEFGAAAHQAFRGGCGTSAGVLTHLFYPQQKLLGKQPRGPAAAGPNPEQRAARHDQIQGSKEAETAGACTRRTDLSAGIGIWSEHVARELNVR